MIPQGSRHPQRHPRQGTAPPGASSGRGTSGEPGKAAKGSILRSQTPPASPAASPASSPGWSRSLPAVKSRHLPAAPPPPPAAAAAPAPGQAPEEVSSKPGRKTCQTKEKRGGKKKISSSRQKTQPEAGAERHARGVFAARFLFFGEKKAEFSPSSAADGNWR